MRVLVAYASKHGATAQIAERLSERLISRGLTVELEPVASVDDLAAIDAAVIGSAVYAGHWRSEATEFVESHVDELERVPVWLFSSGPVGDPPLPEGEPIDMLDLAREISAWGERVFAGKIDKSELNLAERLIVAALHAPEGDFRDWDAIDAWGDEIARALESTRREVG